MTRPQRRSLGRQAGKGRVDVVLFPEATRIMLRRLTAQRDAINQRIADTTAGASTALSVDFSKDDWALLPDCSGVERMKPAPAPVTAPAASTDGPEAVGAKAAP